MKSKIETKRQVPPVKIVRRAAGTPLTKRQLDEVKSLAEMPDDQIDTSDIPEWTEEMWARAVRNPFYRPIKKQVTVRVDADVLEWVKQKGAGYQTRINALLRQAMLAERMK